MSSQHPDLPAEQAYVDHAYRCLEVSRAAAWRMRDMHEADLGGTFQARFERNAVDEALVRRLVELDLGNAALVFGRIDTADVNGEPNEAFHIGRLAVADDEREPVVIDWRAPVAEPFYRATGRDPMGLVRRRHFSVEGRTVLGLEDELFGEGHIGLGGDGTLTIAAGDSTIRGHSTLMAALERGRTGALGDIVATIQAEQDEIIRAPQAGVLVVQGGPGTGKTVVALHRAAYLLYTHRFPLEDQGVLVVGPNRVFLRYIEQVLPSLGESGIDQVVLADLVPEVRVSGRDRREVAEVKGRLAMSALIDRAIRDRERPLRADLVVPYRSGYVRLRVEESRRLVGAMRRRQRRHNPARRLFESEFWTSLAMDFGPETDPADVRDDLRGHPDIRAALEWMWPVLTPAELLHDLFGSRALLKSAARGVLDESTALTLYRERSATVGDVVWTSADVALLDDAREALGPTGRRGGALVDEIRTYGHIVVDEAQDLTPMELAMISRRSLNGSMTIVGDLAQATGTWVPASWEEIVAHLPSRRGATVVGLSVGYRIPAQIMAIADRVMAAAAPGLRAPTSVRDGEHAPRLCAVDAGEELGDVVVAEVEHLRGVLGRAAIGVVAPDDLCPHLSATLTDAGHSVAIATTAGLGSEVTIVPISVVKGLELDGIVVVEPAAIAADAAQGLRSLYVALTRATRALTVVHSHGLPPAMQADTAALSR